MTDLVIDLETSRTPRAFGDRELFWEPQIEVMMRLLEDHCRLCRSQEKNKETIRPELALTILGERGSGKSSLLATFTARLKKERPDVYVLPQVDPTLLSPYDNFLHAFVALLLEKIESISEEKGHELHELECRKPLQRLADHLWTANGSPPREEDDPVAAGLERLDRHRSGPLLRRYLKNFLDAVARDLARMRSHDHRGFGSGLFLILPIDDPDMAFDHFTRTLELYRRYLRHPRLVPIFAFSKKLARELLTLQFGHHFGYQKKRIGEKVAFRAEVEELADQFLDKYLPPRTRIALELPQGEVLSARLESGWGRSEGEARPGETAGDLLRRGADLLFGRRDLATSLLPSSLRRLLQLLDVLQQHLGPAYAEPDDSGDGPAHRTPEGDFLATSRAFLQVHQAALGQRGIDPETIFASALDERGPRLLAQALAAAGRGHPVPIWSENQLDGLLLGLLAVAAFRPPGDSGAEEKRAEGAPPSLGGDFNLRWLLRLLLGFYLPLRLPVGSRTEADARPTTPERLVTRLDAGGFPGVLFVHPGGTIRIAAEEGGLSRDLEVGSFTDSFYEAAWRDYSCQPWLRMRDENLDRKTELGGGDLEPFPGLAGLLSMLEPQPLLLVSIWSLCGTNPRPWAAVSLWRGLDLLARVLERPDDLAGQIYEHTRGLVVKRAPSAVPQALLDPGRLDVWNEASLREESQQLAKELAEWLAALPRSSRQRQIRHLHGPAIERDLLSPLAAMGSQLRAHSWGGGTLLKGWLRRLLDFSKGLGLAERLAGCPLVQPLLSDSRGEWRLAIRQRVDDEEDSALGDWIEIDHALRPAEVFDLLIPADSERYFARFRRSLRDAGPAAML